MTKHEKSGFYLGRYYSDYVDDVKTLEREGKFDEAIDLLLHLIKAIEAESKAKQWVIAPWY